MNIRPVLKTELEKIVSLNSRAGLDGWGIADFASALEWDGVDFRVAEEPETKSVHGFFLSRMVADELELLKLAVDPMSQGKGVGTQLLRACLSGGEEGGALCCFLEVRVSNAQAIRLYERHGFVHLFARRSYYSNPREDAVVMVKSLRRPTPGDQC